MSRSENADFEGGGHEGQGSTSKALWSYGSRTLLWTAPFFVLPIAYLALHRLGLVPRDHRIAYERAQILMLGLYWLVAAGLVVLVSRRSWLRVERASLVLLAVSLALALGFGEVALRLIDSQPAQDYERWSSPTLHHRNAPARKSPGMFGHEVATNEDGFRTVYSVAEFRSLAHRVVLLGDSYLFGLGVAERDSVAAVLESELRAAWGGSVGVLNTGVISYSPLLEREVLRRVVLEKYRPTHVMLLLDVNDIGDDYQYSQENVGLDLANPRFDVPDGPGRRSLCSRSYLCRRLDPLWSKLFLPLATAKKLLGWHAAYDYYRFEVRIGDVVERDRFFVLRHPLAQTAPFFERTLGFVDDIATTARRANIPFSLVVMPRYFHWNDAECPRNWEAFRYKVDEPFENEYLRFFDEARQRVDFPIFSLLPAFSAHRGGPLVFAQDPHWNEAGHEVAGKALARWLIATEPSS